MKCMFESPIRDALDAESARALGEAYPSLAAAIEAEVGIGTTANDVHHLVMDYTRNPGLARWCRSAARHLAALKAAE